ncbi:ubl carboxyl-terminal hydrolase 18 isoform X3 [Pyrgilauda ruficollis]|uniref:ubl carboxyl-terminal hydrolase 18 isoform X3 n=1 Tax=Pyrgilauda ruficollis TaxID=221976 RepID=UPI001B85B582|nr:ubl carboxyl-terminal hydrolase 18 isoform X3 [Pyrgilauda ruficollis]
MGQTSGREERSRKPEVAPSKIMEAEIEVQNNKEEPKEVKAKNQKLTSVFGLADLKNEAIGLYNLGQSCCLNSLLQVFLMNIRFTRILRRYLLFELPGVFPWLHSALHSFFYMGCAFERITVPSSPAQRRSNVPYQMLLLLEKMQCGKCKAVGPTDLARCLSEHRVELFVQHDAAQLFLTLWNLLKKQMKKAELVEELCDLYTICIQEHVACQKCSFEVKSKSTMLTLPLPVLDAHSHRLKTLEDCLQYFFHPEELSGQNMCFCQQCGRKTTFLQATWQYELFAVVAHSGSASCGHYCAYIRSLTDCKWYCFNDSEVCQVSWDDVKCTYGHSNLYWRETAYLLFYMKKQAQQPWPGVSECL